MFNTTSAIIFEGQFKLFLLFEMEQWTRFSKKREYSWLQLGMSRFETIGYTLSLLDYWWTGSASPHLPFPTSSVFPRRFPAMFPSSRKKRKRFILSSLRRFPPCILVSLLSNCASPVTAMFNAKQWASIGEHYVGRCCTLVWQNALGWVH